MAQCRYNLYISYFTTQQVTPFRSVHPSELLKIVPHVLYTGSEALANDFLLLFAEVQEPFYKLPVDETEGGISVPNLVPKGSPGFEMQVANTDNMLCQAILETQQKIPILGCNFTVEIKGAFGLHSC